MSGVQVPPPELKALNERRAPLRGPSSVRRLRRLGGGDSYWRGAPWLTARGGGPAGAVRVRWREPRGLGAPDRRCSLPRSNNSTAWNSCTTRSSPSSCWATWWLVMWGWDRRWGGCGFAAGPSPGGWDRRLGFAAGARALRACPWLRLRRLRGRRRCLLGSLLGICTWHPGTSSWWSCRCRYSRDRFGSVPRRCR